MASPLPTRTGTWGHFIFLPRPSPGTSAEHPFPSPSRGRQAAFSGAELMKGSVFAGSQGTFLMGASWKPCPPTPLLVT